VFPKSLINIVQHSRSAANKMTGLVGESPSWQLSVAFRSLYMAQGEVTTSMKARK